MDQHQWAKLVVWQVMEAFRFEPRRMVLTTYFVARAYLGLTDVQARIIARSTNSRVPASAAPKLWKLWGFESPTLTVATSIPDPSSGPRRVDSGDWLDSGNWKNSVLTGRVDVFLQQSGLKYIELLELLDTYYVNPSINGISRTIHIVSNDREKWDTCETNRLHLEGVDELAGGRIVGFVRLKVSIVPPISKKTAWTDIQTSPKKSNTNPFA